VSQRPFSCGSQYIDWQARNCERCAKYNAEEADPLLCELDFALGVAALTDGEVPDDIARRMGYSGDPQQFTWDCPERELV
jgi:hypothetical protein